MNVEKSGYSSQKPILQTVLGRFQPFQVSGKKITPPFHFSVFPEYSTTLVSVLRLSAVLGGQPV